MKWVLAKMLNLDAERLTIASDTTESQHGTETIYTVTQDGHIHRIPMKQVLEYIEKNMKDDRISGIDARTGHRKEK